MNVETRSQSLNRKRFRKEVNLNTTSEIPYKQAKCQSNNNTSSMATDNDFVDLSSSINSRRVQNNRANENIVNPVSSLGINASENLGPEVRELVVDETLVVQRALEEKMKNMIQEEMGEMKRSIIELSKAVKELSVSRSQSATCERGQESINAQHNNLMFNTDNNGTGANNVPQRNEAETERIINFGLARGSFVTPENHQRNNERISIRVNKWGIIFDGINSHMRVEDFIFRIEYLQAHYDISWEEILRDFHLLVTGTAKNWYWLLVRTHGSLRWPTLKGELRNQYHTNVSNFEMMRDLVERRQQNNETLDTYFFEMSKLRARLLQPIPEYDMIKILKRNLWENVAGIVYPISVSSVEQLRIECQEAERNFPRKEIRTNFPQHRFARNVNEVAYDDMEKKKQQVKK